MARKKEIPAPQFVGGATLEEVPLKLEPGWRFAEDGSPGKDFQIVRVCAFRTRPDGDYRKLFRWALRPSIQNETRSRVERLRMDILREDSEAIARADRRLLARKNRINGVRPRSRKARR